MYINQCPHNKNIQFTPILTLAVTLLLFSRNNILPICRVPFRYPLLAHGPNRARLLLSET